MCSPSLAFLQEIEDFPRPFRHPEIKDSQKYKKFEISKPSKQNASTFLFLLKLALETGLGQLFREGHSNEFSTECKKAIQHQENEQTNLLCTGSRGLPIRYAVKNAVSFQFSRLGRKQP